MNIGEKIDYMIKCLEIAKEEYEYSTEFLANEPNYESDKWSEFYETHRNPNKALIKDNLKNVARIGFQIANEV